MLRGHRTLVIAATVAILAAFGGVLAWRWATPPALPRDASPETVARTYFELDASGRSIAATRLVSDSGCPDIPDGRGYGGCRIIRVSKAWTESREGYASWTDPFVQLCMVTVDYHRTRADEAGNPPGDYSATVDLGRKAPSDPWRVLSVGDSPV
jgi:hypothetical protein